MFDWIFFLTFLLLAALSAFIGVMRGRKYKWQLSASRMILLIVSAFIASLASSGIAMVSVKLFIKPLSSISFFAAIDKYSLGISPVSMVAVFIATLVATVVFVPLFWTVRGLLRLLLKLLTSGLIKLTSMDAERKELSSLCAQQSEDTAEDTVDATDTVEIPSLAKKDRYNEFKTSECRWKGAVCGGICGFLTMFMMAIPVVGLLNTVNDIASPALEHVDLGVVNKAAQVVDAAANNVGSKAVRVAGGELVYNMMTYCKADDNTTSVTVRRDMEDVSRIVGITAKHGTLWTFFSDSQKALSNEQSTYELMQVLFNNPRLIHAADMISDEVIDGFMYKVRVPKSKAPLYDDFLKDIQNVSGADEQTLTASFGEIFDNYGLRVDESKKQNAAQAKLSGQDMLKWTEQNIVADRATFCTVSECMTVEDIIEGEADVVYTENEAKALAHAISVVCSLSADVNSPKFDIKNMMRQLGPVFDSYSVTETVGPIKTEYMLIAILQSKLVQDKIGLTVLSATDSAKSIYENAKIIGYSAMMNSLSKAVEVVENASDSKKDTSEAVKAMLEDLTPQSSKVLQTMATPEVMRKYGVPERSAAPVSAMVSDTFKNLSQAKENGMSDDEYAKESAAVSNMMDILMVSDKKANAPTFGEGSVTGVSAQKYVDNIMDSKVMSATVVDKVYTDGKTPTIDPLDSRRVLSQSEMAEFTLALTNRWNSSDKSEQTKKKLISIASMLNVRVEVGENAVTESVDLS